jgi:hypothetical protein
MLVIIDMNVYLMNVCWCLVINWCDLLKWWNMMILSDDKWVIFELIIMNGYLLYSLMLDIYNSM